MSAEERPVTARLSAYVWLVGYGAVLAVIAFWPTPVDQGARGFLRDLAVAFPLLSYGLIEFVSNILLFVPLGVLLSLAVPKHVLRVTLLSVGITSGIEVIQLVLLPARTGSVADIFANTLGACIGIMSVALRRSRAARSRAERHDREL